MQIEFKGWAKSKDNPIEKKIEGKLLGSRREFNLDDEVAAKLHGMDIKKNDVFNAVVSGKMMVKKETGNVYYWSLKIVDVLE